MQAVIFRGFLQLDAVIRIVKGDHLGPEVGLERSQPMKPIDAQDGVVPRQLGYQDGC